ncbi:hypothetical protein [Kutzneria kofuensis]|uniref:hypothetical protein n=1 Tax=Kutzneria kofuensis TaxID=103725 RepID=UPI001C86039B|nr:hypothetical protein [Kutzneria kofuensis]
MIGSSGTPPNLLVHAERGHRLGRRARARWCRPATPDTTPAADASLRGTAAELVLALYGRVPVDSLKADGDRRLFDQLIAWEPE